LVSMTEACAEHRGLVYHIARQYRAVCLYDRAADTEDLVQAGYIGLMRAVQTYDESKGIFSSWAVIHIKLEMRKVLGINHGKQRADMGAASLNEVVPGTEDSTLLDTLEAPVDIEGDFDHAELVEGVRTAVGLLPDSQSTLVRMHDLQGKGLAEAGNRCGLEPPVAYQAHRNAIKKLRRDPRLLALAKAHHLDRRTNWYHHVSSKQYKSTWMSSTEAIAFWREQKG
jgi:RNA polymerase sporulation-specific sigma factor